MASMSFIVPDEVKKAFDKAYAGQNKSAVMTELMREAIAETLNKRTLPQHSSRKSPRIR
jgi:predicted transcriptional regulator